MYAIVNIKKGSFLYGTDYRYHPPHQITSKNKMITFETLEEAKHAFKNRKCGRDYRIAVLDDIKVKGYILPNEEEENDIN